MRCGRSASALEASASGGCSGPTSSWTSPKPLARCRLSGGMFSTRRVAQARLWSGPMADRGRTRQCLPSRTGRDGNFRADVLDALETTGLAPRQARPRTDRDPRRTDRRVRQSRPGSASPDRRAYRDRRRRHRLQRPGQDRRPPVDILKIDKQFIGGLPDDARCGAITRAVLSLGYEFGSDRHRRGHRTAGATRALVEWGCELGQGFLFGQAAATVDGTTSVGSCRQTLGHF